MGTYEEVFVRERISFERGLGSSRVRYMDFKKEEKRMLDFLFPGKVEVSSKVELHGTITGRFSAKQKVT